MIDPDDDFAEFCEKMPMPGFLLVVGCIAVCALSLARGFQLLAGEDRPPHTPEQFQNPNLPPDL